IWLKKWNLENLVSMVVNDNASNILAAIKLCKWRSLGCFAHSINLVVDSGLGYKDVNDIILKVKAIVQYFKQSSQALIRLNDNQIKGGHPILKLKQNCPTRWNSTYDMINRILKIKDPVLSTLAVLNNDLNNITNHEWNILNNLCKLLKIFYDITNEISSEKSVSIFKILIFSKAMSNYALGISIGNDNEEIEENTQNSESAGSETIWKDFDTKVSQSSGGARTTVAGILEFDRYLAEPLLKRTEDPLAWWHERKFIYPRLYLMVCRRLCVVATSVSMRTDIF
ncbi:zinc finger BED domain-containing protein 1-like, partial [Aphis craccivora]